MKREKERKRFGRRRGDPCRMVEWMILEREGRIVEFSRGFEAVTIC